LAEGNAGLIGSRDTLRLAFRSTAEQVSEHVGTRDLPCFQELRLVLSERVQATPAAIPGVAPEASARLLALLSAEPAVEEVWLYGSRAMGRHHAGSDIDLSLRLELPESLAQHVARVGRRLLPG